ncbi:hypothetical protein ACJ73_07977 [Blastomyces percursus]|uniref:Uncharacterized protein n=1 Tax=Blastomyces percursus TaxID=1658174 RepID=A0A1J9QWX8_9EURO|nr:hypothetical protein ACJ73_07977 [Blastomyces percursus]
MRALPTSVLRTLTSPPAPLCTNLPILRNLPHYPPPTITLPIPYHHHYHQRQSLSERGPPSHQPTAPLPLQHYRRWKLPATSNKNKNQKQHHRHHRHDNAKKDRSSQEQASKPNNNGSRSSTNNNPQFPKLSFESLGLVGNMKILCFSAAGNAGHDGDCFWCKAIWGWWRGNGDEETDKEKEKGKGKEKVGGGGAGVSKG